jgi:transposase
MTTPAKELPNDVSALKGLVAEQNLNLLKKEEENERLRLQNDRLIEIVRLLRHRQFGASSEKIKAENPDQLGIFNEAELEALTPEAATEDANDTIEVTYKRRRGTPRRVALPAHLPREEVVIELPLADRVCPEGHELKEIGEEVSEQLDVVPASVKVIRTIRKKYACPCCEGHVKRAPLPLVMIPKGLAAAGLLAHIITSKYSDGLPLYRQEHMWKRAGVEIGRGTMASWMMKIGDKLIPLINLLDEELLASAVLNMDETTVQVLNEAGKTAQSKSFMWVRGRKYADAPPIVIFEYDPTRKGDVAKRLLEGYHGRVQCDGYGGYDWISRCAEMIRLGCWAHVRRKFFEAMKASKKGQGLANEAIEMIRKLYAVEEKIKDASVEGRRQARQEESTPLLSKFRAWLNEHLRKVPPTSKLGQALKYADGEWPCLTRYVEDGRCAIDNNFAENAIRPFAIGRKNWLFSDSVAGANASAAIYSILITAKLNGHNEYTYMRHLMERLPYAKKAEDFVALLPTVLKPADVPTDFGPASALAASSAPEI